MAGIKVNTDAATDSALKIKGYNDSLKDKFAIVENAINSLGNSWDGAASENAIRRFNEIKTEYPDNRYAVIDSYVRFVFSRVDDGYAKLEAANASLADVFM